MRFIWLLLHAVLLSVSLSTIDCSVGLSSSPMVVPALPSILALRALFVFRWAIRLLRDLREALLLREGQVPQVDHTSPPPPLLRLAGTLTTTWSRGRSIVLPDDRRALRGSVLLASHH